MIAPAKPRTFREIIRSAGVLELLQPFTAGDTKDRTEELALWKENPDLKSLNFKKIKDDLWSIRAGSGFRALATFNEGRYLWFWIGAHDEYERLLRKF